MPTLPISTILREALPESISDLYSRDVEPMSDEDIDRIIHEQRAHRERMEAAEAAGVRAPRMGTIARNIRPASADGLDFSI